MKRIIIAVDFSDQTNQVLQTGANIAATYGAKILLLHTEEPAPSIVHSNTMSLYDGIGGFGLDMPTAKDIISKQMLEDEALLNQLKERIKEKGLEVETEVFIGNEVSGIIEKCHKFHPDLLVMGLHKKGFFSRLLSNNSELSLVKKAPCPLLLIPE